MNIVEDIMKRNSGSSNYNYMWLNVETQKEFAEMFKVESYPSMVVLSYGKRKKYLVHEGEFSADAMMGTIEKINNGDARFTWIRKEFPSLN
mmetsp:Transcript_24393/g.21573  ORF Transcript_24393/g.21573 Transcript_24393/m.21573 type:complete len:91 (-) Transcript_24393:133-405(-)